MHEEEKTGVEEGLLNLQTALAEIQLASPDLADFLVWVAKYGEESDFPSVSTYVLSYAHALNDSSSQGTIYGEG